MWLLAFHLYINAFIFRIFFSYCVFINFNNYVDGVFLETENLMNTDVFDSLFTSFSHLALKLNTSN